MYMSQTRRRALEQEKLREVGESLGILVSEEAPRGTQKRKAPEKNMKNFQFPYPNMQYLSSVRGRLNPEDVATWEGRCRMNNAFQNALQHSVLTYFRLGERSSEKLKPLHYFIGQCVQALLGPYDAKSNPYTVVSYALGIDSARSREEKVDGYLNCKDVDVTVLYEGIPVGAISVKFVMSNYRQNKNNYFESMLGECVNLKLNRPYMKFWHVFVTFDELPYFKKDGTMRPLPEKVDVAELTRKYQSLLNLRPGSGRSTASLTPDFLSLTLLDRKGEWYKSKKDYTAENNARYRKASQQCFLPNSGSPKLDWLYNLIEFVNAIKQEVASKMGSGRDNVFYFPSRVSKKIEREKC
jgi:hypothetical protein